MRQLLFSLTVLAACAGKAPGDQNPPDEADAGIDTPPAAVGVRVSGKTMDYFTAVVLENAAVSTDGIDPPKTATSVTDGTYALDDIPLASSLFLSATHLNYRLTRNTPTSVADQPVLQDVYVLSIPDVRRQYITGGFGEPTAGQAFLAAEMKNDLGAPLEGIPLANITLVDGAGVPVPGIKGPLFFGANGDVDPALLTSTAFQGRSRVAVFDVPPGTYSLKVTYLDGAGAPKDALASVTGTADGAVLATTGGMLAGGGNLDPTFAADVPRGCRRRRSAASAARTATRRAARAPCCRSTICRRRCSRTCRRGSVCSTSRRPLPRCCSPSRSTSRRRPRRTTRMRRSSTSTMSTTSCSCCGSRTAPSPSETTSG